MKILLSLILILSSYLNASTIKETTVISDTSHKPWSISEERFIQKFGNDDISKVLVKYWFSNRTSVQLIIALTAPFAAIFGYLFFSTVFDKPASANIIAAFIPAMSGAIFIPLLLVLLLG